ncbi:MAG: hypothetical protein JRJ47_07060 [Deltaproteobacteria bacterium]|nr:hypothetical protein [Deltaproteobacteria bacterium]
MSDKIDAEVLLDDDDVPSNFDGPESYDEEGQLQLLRVDEFAFDEMNIVEIPFSTLSNKASKKTHIPLSPSGEEYLESVSQKHSLPTAMAERTVLGLMWLTWDKNGFNSPKVTFTLRELVEKFMHPGKFTRYRAQGELLQSAERELHRIAATRLHSNRWWDRKNNKHVEIDAAIIDSITVSQEGGRNSSRILEIVWGNKIYNSVRDRYTKSFDIKTWLQIKKPMDGRLFRWLDRQLDGKSQQEVKSCQKWAKYKMLMQSKKIERGGRTASSYILEKVSDSISRLNDLKFGVRLVVDKSEPDFSFRFEKIPEKRGEVVDRDETGNLVFEFKKLFHGSKKKGRLKEADRRVAAKWIESYGFEKSIFMVGRCRDLHLAGRRGEEPLYSFKALEFYETRAEADFEREKEDEAGQLDMTLDRERREKWNRYAEGMLAEADQTLDLAELKAEAESRAGELYPEALKSGLVKDRIIEAELKKLKLERVGAMSEEEFLGLKDDEPVMKN